MRAEGVSESHLQKASQRVTSLAPLPFALHFEEGGPMPSAADASSLELLPSGMHCVFALSELLALSTAVGGHERAPKEWRYESGELLRPIEKLIAVLSSICVVKPSNHCDEPAYSPTVRQ